FFLRGYEENSITGHRFALGTVEYRFPIWFPQRGIGKGMIFWDSIVGTAFYEIGNAWEQETSLSEFRDSVGAELRINAGFQYNLLPVTFRLGFAQGLDEDEGESQVFFTIGLNFWL
ncbi:BamA/TamA family outer membrane protein, partial [candidate division KSB3 bacterium]|nr:BamA/TamA family outer membrane protein [candidate division KSB3 bacterium]MBD3325267.1 BamA/TamA family outer membrane protein [candidate division KSB3 bacterium]